MKVPTDKSVEQGFREVVVRTARQTYAGNGAGGAATSVAVEFVGFEISILQSFMSFLKQKLPQARSCTCSPHIAVGHSQKIMVQSFASEPTPEIFRLDERGAVLPIFALLMVAIVALAGLGLDYTRTSHAKSRLNAAVDSANLAAARAAADLMAKNPDMEQGEAITQAEQIGLKFLNSNLAGPDVKVLESVALKVSYKDGFGLRRRTTGPMLRRRSLRRSAARILSSREAARPALPQAFLCWISPCVSIQPAR